VQIKGPSVREVHVWGYETFPNARRDWIKVPLPDNQIGSREFTEIMDWCREQFGYQNFFHSNHAVLFEKEHDATMFKLRWL